MAELRGQAKKIDRLIETKTKLADKYERKAINTASQPQRKSAMYRSNRFRRQIANLIRQRDAIVAEYSN
ncbi:hypothetical protein [Thalassoroseus pseudoceratinae]|uniref:hypothetical protein n=1 Tax=Thalassoroseus pseudoceratinae TaxID=2713176 RepID=UPI00141F6A59|nr:hypothetical protein [Thalassoroseus pseudoceratinae]